jgi:hypothetical protein
MAFIHGRNTFISLDGDDLSTFVTSSEFSRSADSHDVTTYGKNAKVYQSGLTDASCTLEGIYDNGATGPRDVIEPLIGGDAVTLIRRPEGTGAGRPQDSVSVIVTSYVESSPVADMVTWSCELQCTDDINTTNQT